MAIITLTKDNFKQEVYESDKPVLVDFWAIWCGPCQMLGPIVDQFAEENEASVKVCKVNVDDNAELTEEFDITTVPTLMLFKDGNVAETRVGLQSKSAIMKMLGV